MAGDGVAVGATKGIEIRVIKHLIIEAPCILLSDAYLAHAYNKIDEQCLLLGTVKVEPGLIDHFFDEESLHGALGEKFLDGDLMRKFSLNPYCSGICSMSCWSLAALLDALPVLILIVVEYAL